jgi:Polyketide synthase dehydratase
MRIDLDSVREAFLDDHRVDGTPLLPTVMGVDLMGRAAIAKETSPLARVIEVRELVVGPPVLVPEAVTTPVDVIADRGQRGVTFCRVVGVGPQHGRPPHFRAHIVIDDRPPGAAPVRPVIPELAYPLRAELVYPPYFHGPAFRVIGGAARTADGIVAHLADALPPLGWSRGALTTAPRLLELALQTCGLWELAATKRMMIPHGIDTIQLASGVTRARLTSTIAAFVRPRAESRDGQTVFDCQVVDGPGRIVLAVKGYRTVDLGHSVDAAFAARIRNALDQPVELAPASP